LFGILVFTVIGIYISQKACNRDSALEKKIDKTEQQAVTKDIEVADAKTQADQQSVVTKAAVKRTQATRQATPKNTSVADAEKAVKVVYPEEIHESKPADRTIPVTQEFIDTAKHSAQEVQDLRAENTEHVKNEVSKDAVIQKQTEDLKLKDTEITYYKALKCESTSFLFGLIKKKRCK
jgi:hypothetical protein